MKSVIPCKIMVIYQKYQIGLMFNFGRSPDLGLLPPVFPPAQNKPRLANFPALLVRSDLQLIGADTAVCIASRDCRARQDKGEEEAQHLLSLKVEVVSADADLRGLVLGTHCSAPPG